MANKEKGNPRKGATPRVTRPKSLRLEDLNFYQPITPQQELVWDEYQSHQNLLLSGSAGTGKTFMSMYLGLMDVLDKGSMYDKLIVCRSAVPTRDMGFLPGTAEEKEDAYTLPYKGICAEFFEKKEAWDMLREADQIEFLTTSYIRGVTLDNCIVVVDECQNLTFHELDSVITRMGNNTKIIFSGDYNQSDFKGNNDKKGIQDFTKIVKHLRQFTMIEFGWQDIVRSGLVRDYIMTKECVDRGDLN
jgi:phosphate starvation-inducible protein PhoH